MLRNKTAPFLLCLILAACASHASPEDAQMADTLNAQGKTLLATGKKSEARDIYLSAVCHDDRNARAWNGLGVSYDLLGKKDKAQDAFQHAIELAPKDLTFVNNMAHLQLEQDNPAEAVRLLTPYANDAAAPLILKQNLATAVKAAAAKESLGGNTYADLGSYPTEGMAQGHSSEAKSLMGHDAEALSFLIVPEVKISGGTPLFTVKVTGKDPQEICEVLNPKAVPCIPYGKSH